MNSDKTVCVNCYGSGEVRMHADKGVPVTLTVSCSLCQGKGYTEEKR